MNPCNSSEPAANYLVALANVAAERHAAAVLGRRHSEEIARRLARIASAWDRRPLPPKPGGAETLSESCSDQPLPDELLRALARLRTARKELERARRLFRVEEHERLQSQPATVVVSVF